MGRTQITNYTFKSASSVSNSLGSVVVSYSIFHALISLADDNHSYLTDEAKSCISGALTGTFFKSTTGLVKCAKGGFVGLGLAAVWAFGLRKTRHRPKLYLATDYTKKRKPTVIISMKFAIIISM